MSRFIKSFGYAFNGIAYAIKTQLNFRLHFIAMFFVVAAGWYFKVSVAEWFWLVASIGGVLITELFNTAIELLVDLVSPTYHEKAKTVKDVSAAAVLFAAITALIIGLIIFIPKIFYAA